VNDESTEEEARLDADPLDPEGDPSTANAAEDDPSSEAVPAPLREALERRGFEELTSVQHAVLRAGGTRDLQISSQTGSGKTVALGFVMAPRLIARRAPDGSADAGRRPTALVIVPTRELAAQVQEELKWLFAGVGGVRVASVTGGTPLYGDRRTLQPAPEVLVGTPGRLLDHIKSGVLSVAGVAELVLDEADQMLDLGFREDLEAILESMPAERRTHLVSATFPPEIVRLAARYQHDPLAIHGTRPGEANADIEHVALLVPKNQRYAVLVNLLLLLDGSRTLVFVDTRAETARVAERLAADGFAAAALSGELHQTQRTRTLASFRAGTTSVLVATDVAARGLDVSDVAAVVHTSLPSDGEIYTHRSGRTGRAGQAGRSWLLVPPERRRAIARRLADWGVEVTWRPAPDAAEVRDVLRERAHAELARKLAGAEPEASYLQEAQRLLGETSAELLVARLLALAEPRPRTEPRALAAPAPAAHREDDGRVRAPHAAPRPRPSSGAFVRFFINWGAAQGATPSRVLATVCRRGDIRGQEVGNIDVRPNGTTFEVLGEVAESFERRAEIADPRSPYVRIRRDRIAPHGSTFPGRHTTHGEYDGAGHGGGGTGFRGAWSRRPRRPAHGP